MKKIIVFVVLFFTFSLCCNAEVKIKNVCANNSSRWVLNANCGNTDSIESTPTSDPHRSYTYKPPVVKETPGEVIPGDDEEEPSEDCPEIPTSTNEKYNIFVLIDVSHSMADTEKIKIVNKALNGFIKTLKDTNVNANIKIWGFNEIKGVFSLYKGNSFYSVKKVPTNTTFLSMSDVPSKSATFIQGGLFAAYDELKCDSNDSKCKKRTPVLLLLTDGAPTQMTTSYSVADRKSGTHYKAAGEDFRAGIVTPANYLYYTLRTLVSLKTELKNSNGKDPMIFTFSTGSSASRDYALAPSDGRYKKMEGSEFYNLITAGKQSEHTVAGVIQHGTLTYKSAKKIKVAISKSTKDSYDTLKLNIRFKGLSNRGITINGRSYACSNYRGYDCRYNISTSLIKNFDKKNNVYTAYITTNSDYYVYDATKAKTHSDYFVKYPVDGFWEKKLTSSNMNDIVDIFTNEITKEMKPDPDCVPKLGSSISTPDVILPGEKYYAKGDETNVNYTINTYSAPCDEIEVLLSNPLEGENNFYYNVWYGKRTNSGGTKTLRFNEYVKIRDRLSVKVIVTEKSSFTFGNINNNNSVYAGGGFDLSGTSFSNEVDWKFSRIDENNNPVVEDFKLNVYIKGNELDNNKKKRISITDICVKRDSNHDCQAYLTRQNIVDQVTAFIKTKLKSHENDTIELFNAVDSNDANKDNDSVSGTVSKNSNNKYIFNLSKSCIKKNGEVYYSGIDNCDNNSRDGGNLRYVPLNYKGSSLDVSVSGYNISDYDGITITVNGKCSVNVTKHTINYRSIDEDNPFPKGAAANWGGNNSTIKDKYIRRIGKFFEDYKNGRIEYSYIGDLNFGTTSSTNYNSFDGINMSTGTSQFVNNQLQQRIVTRSNYCPLGILNSTCNVERGG